MKDEDKKVIAHFLFPDRKMSEGVTRMLHNVTTAERICRLKYRDEGNVKDIYLQVHKDRTMIFCNNKPDSPPYELYDREAVKRACLCLFNCSEQEMRKASDPEFPALLMSKRKYGELKENSDATDEQYLAECLAAINGDNTHSVQLASLIRCNIREGELKLCAHSDSGMEFKYATFVGDHTSGWLLRMSCDVADDWLVAIPMSKAQLCSYFTEWVLHSTSMGPNLKG